MTIHVVKAGETVGSIAEFYGVAPARLASDNGVPATARWQWDRPWWYAFPALSMPWNRVKRYTPLRTAMGPQSGPCGRTTSF